MNRASHQASLDVEREALAQSLANGLMGLGLALDTQQQTRLLDYLTLMAKWNTVYNLTAIRVPQAMLVQHLLDSLAVIPILTAHLQKHSDPLPAQLLDVGSGAGLPGIPIALALPHMQVTLIDPVQKKTAFLTQAKVALGLDNLTVINDKVEHLPAAIKYDVISSRAFSTLREFVILAQHVLAPDGFFLAMKGTIPVEEMRQLPPGFTSEVVTLQVPSLDAERCVVLIRKECKQPGFPHP